MFQVLLMLLVEQILKDLWNDNGLIPDKCWKNENNPKIRPTKNDTVGFSINAINIIGIWTVVILTGPNGINPIGESDKIITIALKIPIFVIDFVEIFFMNSSFNPIY